MTGPATATPELWLTLVHHCEPRTVGISRVIVRGSELLLGRTPMCCFPGVLARNSVSREHARIAFTGETPHVEDLGSRNGTWLNGARVERAELQHGDVLCVGDVLLLIHRTIAAPEPISHPELIGASAGLAHVLRQVQQVAERDTPVIILGETGVGKELVARAIHRGSRRSGEFVAVNCGAVDDHVLASELFGHARGAFSGAVSRREGLIASARAGTILLDEIEDASPRFQQSLLRLLETSEYRAVGSDRAQQAHTRFLFAAQPSILQSTEEGGFRRDLWMRMARWVVRVPPLRERPEDIPFLIRHAADLAGRPGAEPDQTLALALLRHSWPGNVRELMGLVSRAVIESPSMEVLEMGPALSAALEDAPPPAPLAPARVEPPPAPIRRNPVRRPPRDELLDLLQRHGGSVRAAAKELGVPRKSIYRWSKELEIDLRAQRAAVAGTG